MNRLLARALPRVSSPPIRRHAAAATPVLSFDPALPPPPPPPPFLRSSPGGPPAAAVQPRGASSFHTRVGGGVAGGNKGSQMPRRPAPPPDDELDEAFLKGSGPGGQKINKTNSAVQLRHRPTGLVVKCQATRSRTENRKIARQLLADKLDDLARGDQSRAAVVGEWRAKKRASSAKKSRRKYRKLEDEKAAAAAAANADDVDDADTAQPDEGLLADPPLDQGLENRGRRDSEMGGLGQTPRPGQRGSPQDET